MINSTKMQKR